MAHLTTTNAYFSYHATNTREYQALMNTAIAKFDPKRTFKLNADNADDFATTVESYAHQFGYIGETARVATSCVFDPTSVNSFTSRDRKNIIGT